MKAPDLDSIVSTKSLLWQRFSVPNGADNNTATFERC